MPRVLSLEVANGHWQHALGVDIFTQPVNALKTDLKQLLDPYDIFGLFDSGPGWVNPKSSRPVTSLIGGKEFGGIRLIADQRYGLPDLFWSWYHRQYKKDGDPDLTAGEARELYKQWQAEGEPDAEGHRTKPSSDSQMVVPPVEIPDIPLVPSDEFLFEVPPMPLFVY